MFLVSFCYVIMGEKIIIIVLSQQNGFWGEQVNVCSVHVCQNIGFFLIITNAALMHVKSVSLTGASHHLHHECGNPRAGVLCTSFGGT